ncbi:MAG: polysaccharide biosynthesis tyrosine autokinase [Anaerolineales bacterium]|nr:polysaccharide biosynthesis tyrosine autokinase [Anaerolineales bacterium]
MESQLLGDDLRRYVSLLWRWAWLVILIIVLSGATTYVVSIQMPPVYQASSSLLINEAPGTKATDYSSIITSERLTQTYAKMLVQKPVLTEVITRLDLTMDINNLKQMITVQPVVDTQLIDIKVEDTDPIRAAAIANEIGAVFSEQNQAMQEARYASTKESLGIQLEEAQIRVNAIEADIDKLDDNLEDNPERDRLEVTLAQYRQIFANTLQSYEQVRLAEAETISNVVQAEAADSPTQPIRPQVMMNTALAGIVGAMVAVGLIFLIDVMDDTIRDSDEVNRYLKLPVLGAIRKIDQSEAPVTVVKPRAPVSEDFRSLRTNIQFASVDSELSTILITSPTPEDGKTTVSLNLSIIMAQGGSKVTLIDADLRRPAIHRQMHLSNRWGLTSLFTHDDLRLDGIIRQNKSTGLSIMTSGNLPPNPAELLGSEKMLEIISKVKDISDIIVFDSPPLTVVTDATVLSKRVDGVILIINSGTTKVAAAQQAVEQLRRVDANILGVVLNNVGSQKSYYYSTYTSYYDTYFNDHKQVSKDNLASQNRVKLFDKTSRGRDKTSRQDQP